MIPRIGEIVDGYRFVGGDPAQQSSWESADGMPKAGDVYDGYRFRGGDPNLPDAWEPADASLTSKLAPRDPRAVAQMPGITEAELQTGAPPDRPAAPAGPSRTWAEFADDSLKALTRGGLRLGEGAAMLADLTGPQGGFRVAGAPTANKVLGQTLGHTAEQLEVDRSGKMVELAKQYQGADGFQETVSFLVKNPAYVFDTLLEATAGTAAAGKVGSLAARTVGAIEDRIAREAAQRGAAWAAGATEAAQAAGDVAAQIEQRLEQEGVTDPHRRAAAMTAAIPTMLATFAFGRLGGGVEAKLFSQELRDTGGNVVARVAKDAVKEGVLEEMPQSASEQLFTNVGERMGGLDTPLTKDVGKAAATGLVVGGAMGAGMGALPRGQPSITPPPGAQPTASQVDIENLPADQAIDQILKAPITPVDAPAAPIPKAPTLTDEEVGLAGPSAAAAPAPDTIPASAAGAPTDELRGMTDRELQQAANLTRSPERRDELHTEITRRSMEAAAPEAFDFETTFPQPRRDEMAQAGRDSTFAGMEGDDLAQAISGVHDETAIGIMSSRATVEAIDEMLAKGVDERGKPLTPEKRKALEKEREGEINNIEGTFSSYADEFGQSAETQYRQHVERRFAALKGDTDARPVESGAGPAGGAGELAPGAVDDGGSGAAPLPADDGVELDAPEGTEDFHTGRGELKSFTTEKKALAYAKQKTNRVPGNFKPRQVAKGEWRLSRQKRERTEAQRANDERLARGRREIAPHDSLAKMMGKLGGLDLNELEADGFDPPDAKYIRSGVIGKPALRRKGGLSLDAMAELLAGYGWDLYDEAGRVDATKLRDMIDDALAGDLYTPEGHEYWADKADQERAEQARAEALPTDEELEEAGYNDLSETAQDAVADLVDEDLDDVPFDDEGKVVDENDELFGDIEKEARAGNHGPGAPERAPGDGGDAAQVARGEAPAQDVDSTSRPAGYEPPGLTTPAQPTPPPGGVAVSEPNEFASTQVKLDDEATEAVELAARGLISPKDLHEKGFEDRPHITVKYGVHSDDPASVRPAIEAHGPIEATVGQLEIFQPEGKDYDVVVIRVESQDLHALNAAIAAGTEVTDTFPTYKPHITLAYVKRGAGKNYSDADSGLEGMRLTFDTVEFSTRDERVTEIPLASKWQETLPRKTQEADEHLRGPGSVDGPLDGFDRGDRVSRRGEVGTIRDLIVIPAKGKQKERRRALVGFPARDGQEAYDQFNDLADLTKVEPQALELTGETEREIRAREAREKKAADAKAKQDAAPDASDFVLTGSNRAVDQARARGQEELFGNVERHRGKEVTQTLALEDGAEADLTMDAAEALKDLNQRIATMEELKACL